MCDGEKKLFLTEKYNLTFNMIALTMTPFSSATWIQAGDKPE